MSECLKHADSESEGCLDCVLDSLRATTADLHFIRHQHDRYKQVLTDLLEFRDACLGGIYEEGIVRSALWETTRAVLAEGKAGVIP